MCARVMCHFLDTTVTLVVDSAEKDRGKRARSDSGNVTGNIVAERRSMNQPDATTGSCWGENSHGMYILRDLQPFAVEMRSPLQFIIASPLAADALRLVIEFDLRETF